LVLGRLCLRSRLWGKARSYLETSIGVQPSPEAYQELGLLLEQMGELEQAMVHYRAGLELAANSPATRTWEFDGRKPTVDNDPTPSPLNVSRPVDAELPLAEKTS